RLYASGPGQTRRVERLPLARGSARRGQDACASRNARKARGLPTGAERVMNITLDKIASSTARLSLPREVEISPHIEAKEGNVLAVRALMEKSVYDRLELVSGRMAKINRGDVIAGTLGFRRALKGFVGVVPESIHVGDKIHVLNLGGVLGLCVGRNPDVGSPLETEVLGAICVDGKQANISQNALPPRDLLPEGPPLAVVAGTRLSPGQPA